MSLECKVAKQCNPKYNEAWEDRVGKYLKKQGYKEDKRGDFVNGKTHDVCTLNCTSQGYTFSIEGTSPLKLDKDFLRVIYTMYEFDAARPFWMERKARGAHFVAAIPLGLALSVPGVNVAAIGVIYGQNVALKAKRPAVVTSGGTRTCMCILSESSAEEFKQAIDCLATQYAIRYDSDGFLTGSVALLKNRTKVVKFSVIPGEGTMEVQCWVSKADKESELPIGDGTPGSREIAKTGWDLLNAICNGCALPPEFVFKDSVQKVERVSQPVTQLPNISTDADIAESVS